MNEPRACCARSVARGSSPSAPHGLSSRHRSRGGRARRQKANLSDACRAVFEQ